MTMDEAIKRQKELSEHFDLGFWYGTKCNKCCGVYPKLIIGEGGFNDLCRYECEVCGTTTEPCIMPWVAEEKWNAGEFVEGELRLF